MSVMMFDRAYFVVLLPIVMSNFLSIAILRRRFNNKYRQTVSRGIDNVILSYIILFGLLSALLPE